MTRHAAIVLHHNPAVGDTQPGSLRHRVPKTLLALASLVGLCGLGAGCTQSNTIHRVPAIQGRVVDADTGTPIPGVAFGRWFQREHGIGPGGSDSYQVTGSLVTATSDADGRFKLPAWFGLRGISVVNWYVYKSGWTAACGNLSLVHKPSAFYVDHHGGPPNLVQVETTASASTLIATVTLRRTDTPQAAEEHFGAINVLIFQGLVSEDEFVNEAATYVERHALTEEILTQIAPLLPSGPCDTPYCRDPRIRLLAIAVVDYCDRSPASVYCQPRAPFMIKRLRDWVGNGHVHEK